MNKCEAIGVDFNDNISACDIMASYKCECCKKSFCVNCMYMMCSKCNAYVTCYTCGYSYKNIAKNYTIDIDHNCKGV